MSLSSSCRSWCGWFNTSQLRVCALASVLPNCMMKKLCNAPDFASCVRYVIPLCLMAGMWFRRRNASALRWNNLVLTSPTLIYVNLDCCLSLIHRTAAKANILCCASFLNWCSSSVSGCLSCTWSNWSTTCCTVAISRLLSITFSLCHFLSALATC
jgi:hypothetical protein